MGCTECKWSELLSNPFKFWHDLEVSSNRDFSKNNCNTSDSFTQEHFFALISLPFETHNLDTFSFLVCMKGASRFH